MWSFFQLLSSSSLLIEEDFVIYVVDKSLVTESLASLGMLIWNPYLWFLLWLKSFMWAMYIYSGHLPCSQACFCELMIYFHF